MDAFLSLDWRWYRWREDKRSPSIFTLLYPSQLRHPCQCWVPSFQPWRPLTRDGSETPGEAPGGRPPFADLSQLPDSGVIILLG